MGTLLILHASCGAGHRRAAEAAADLESRGVPPGRIRVTGIPVDPHFARHAAARILALALGTAPERLAAAGP
jgi:hypothetical protein